MPESIQDVESQAVVQARGVNFWFGEGELQRQILFDVEFAIQPGEVVLLTGESGSGKTTLLTLIGALRTLTDGSLTVLGQELLHANAATLVAIRRKIGFIFQAHNLLPHLSALDNARLPLELSPEISQEEGIERASALLTSVGVGHRMHAFPSRLSGGEKQRVAVARSLMGHPDLILADEPTSALDSRTGREVIELLVNLTRGRGVPILIVSHDARIFDLTDRAIHMEDGRILLAGWPGHRGVAQTLL